MLFLTDVTPTGFEIKAVTFFYRDVTPTGFEIKAVTFFYRDVTPTGFIPDFHRKLPMPPQTAFSLCYNNRYGTPLECLYEPC